MALCQFCTLMWWLYFSKTHLPKISKIKSPKIAESSLIVFVGMSVLCVALFLLRFFYFFYDLITFDLIETKRETGDTFFSYCNYSRMQSILFINGSSLFWLTGSLSIYCWITRLVMFEKKMLRRIEVFSSFSHNVVLQNKSDFFIGNYYIW